MPLPVAPLAASILISKSPVVSSGDLNVRPASHLSNLPAIVTDDFTWNLIELCTGIISKTGACARPRGTNNINAEIHRVIRCTLCSLDFVHFIDSPNLSALGRVEIIVTPSPSLLWSRQAPEK